MLCTKREDNKLHLKLINTVFQLLILSIYYQSTHRLIIIRNIGNDESKTWIIKLYDNSHKS